MVVKTPNKQKSFKKNKHIKHCHRFPLPFRNSAALHWYKMKSQITSPSIICLLISNSILIIIILKSLHHSFIRNKWKNWTLTRRLFFLKMLSAFLCLVSSVTRVLIYASFAGTILEVYNITNLGNIILICWYTVWSTIQAPWQYDIPLLLFNYCPHFNQR